MCEIRSPETRGLNVLTADYKGGSIHLCPPLLTHSITPTQRNSSGRLKRKKRQIEMEGGMTALVRRISTLKIEEEMGLSDVPQLIKSAHMQHQTTGQ